MIQFLRRWLGREPLPPTPPPVTGPDIPPRLRERKERLERIIRSEARLIEEMRRRG